MPYVPLEVKERIKREIAFRAREAPRSNQI